MPEIPTGFREPSDAERMLLRRLAVCWPDGPQDWLEQVRVRGLSDGGMGSLRLAIGSQSHNDQVFGRRAAEYVFTDTDGVEVIASLYLDQNGVPFELDVWKVDFTPTRRLERPGTSD